MERVFIVVHLVVEVIPDHVYWSLIVWRTALVDPEFLYFLLHCTMNSEVLHSLGDYTQYTIC